MEKKKTITSYKVRWSMSCCDTGGTIDVPAEDVKGLDGDERDSYFQEMVDDEVNRNGPCGHVDSVREVE